MALFRSLVVSVFVFLIINFAFCEPETYKHDMPQQNSLFQQSFLEGNAWTQTGSISKEELDTYTEKGIDWNPKNPEYSKKLLLNAQDSSEMNNSIIMLFIALAMGFYIFLIVRMQRKEAN